MGKGGKVTIGYWYRMGLHIGLCSGPIDALRKILGDGKVMWTGNITSSTTISINQPNLYGGEKKEGGVAGTLDVMMGEADQQPNAYLVSQLGTPMPAFRGRATLVFRGVVGALNPYIKPWSFLVSRWTAGWRTPVWQAGLCKIGDGANAAHIIYRAITDPVTGLGKDPQATLDLDRMLVAAQTLYDEGFGLCLKWSRSDVIGNFIGMVCDHVGGAMVDDPASGKQYLKLYRGDYDVASLPVLDESTIIELTSYEQSALAGSINQVIVTYHDAATNKDVPVTVSNPANIQAQGRVVTQSTSYPGIPTHDLAVRAAMRDLRATSCLPARLKCTVQSTLDVRKGDVLAFSWARLNISRMPVRVLEIDRGTPGDGKITLSCTQDVCAMPTTTYVVEQPPLWTAPDLTPQPVPAQRLIEASYRDLAATMRPADLAAVAAESSYAAALGARPAGVPYNYELISRVGASGDFRDVAAGDFAPTGTLVAAMPVEAGPTAVTLAGTRDLDQVAVGDEALVDDELCRVVVVDATAGTVTLARGCVDTVPAQHAAGARIWFLDGAMAADPTEYLTGETVQAKLLTRTGQGTLDPALAPTMSLQLAARQIRPYPPGALKVQGISYPASVEGALALSWAHRDRLLQADQLIDTTQGSIGPEPGTTYTVRVYLNGALNSTTTGITGTAATPTVTGDGTVRVEISAVRDGYTSWQAITATFDYTRGARRLTEAGDQRITEAGDVRILES